MPFPNEHSARQLDPAGFEKFRRGKMEGAPPAIAAIYGIQEAGGAILQSVRADADRMSVEAFREWLEEQGLKSVIEKATGIEILGDDDDAETEEEAQKRDREEAKVAKAEKAEAEAKAKVKAAGKGSPTFGPGGSRRYYASTLVWGAACLLSEGPQSWVEIVRSGRFYGNSDGREITLTEADILSMAATYGQVQAEGWFCNDGAPVGYNHAAALGVHDPDSTKAAARVSKVEVRPNGHGGVSLWGLFTWTEEGASRVEAGEFASISAELIPPGAATSKLSGESMGGWCLIGATLTNSPFIPGMQAPQVSGTLAASESQQCRIFLSEAPATEKPPMSDTLVKLAEACGLPAEAPELLAEVQRLQADAAKLTVLTETLETATVELEGLRTRNETLEGREKSRVLDEACTLGRIAPTEREQYHKVLDTLGEADTHRIFVEGRVPVTRDTTDAPEVEGDGGGDASDDFVALMDRAMADGKTGQEAWNLAAAQVGQNLYLSEEN